MTSSTIVFMGYDQFVVYARNEAARVGGNMIKINQFHGLSTMPIRSDRWLSYTSEIVTSSGTTTYYYQPMDKAHFYYKLW
jgi:hypothetical protein